MISFIPCFNVFLSKSDPPDDAPTLNFNLSIARFPSVRHIRVFVDPDVAKETLSCGMVYIPGAFTPTEIRTAHVLGADFVKIFPVSNVGADYVRAVKAPLSDIKYLAVGGINPDNISEYLKAGVCGFGIGASIAPKSMLDSGDYDGITDLAKKYVSRVK